MGYTFLSYSRRQLYFAESLALRLEISGLDIWFDLQRLVAGTDWARVLETGISEAERMVLVVSEASIESLYTCAEWQTHLSSGKPLILVIAEPVVLPDNLAGLPVLDFTQDFEAQTERLVAFLNGDSSAPADPVPIPNRLRLRTRLPRDIKLVLFTLAASLLTGLLMFSHMFPALIRAEEMKLSELGSLAPPLLVLAAIALFSPFQFIQHRASQIGTQRWSLVSLALQFLISMFGVFILMDITEMPLSLGAWLFFVLPVLGLFGLSLYVHLRVLPRSADVLRWFEAGQASQKLRRRIHDPLVQAANVSLDLQRVATIKPVDFELHFDDEDQPLARRIAKAFERVGHRRVESDGDASHHIAIVTNRKLAELGTGHY